MVKLPPIEKVYEAWSAVVDGRVQLQGPDMATVTSSDGERTYTVKYDIATDTYLSNDNATLWAGYPGYPVLAVMMLRERLPLDLGVAQQFGDINWNQLNAKYKRDYAAALRHIEDERGIDSERAAQAAQAVMSTLAALPINCKALRGKAAIPAF